MRRILLPLTVVAAATAMLVFLLPSGSAAANPTLQGSVGPGFVITLRDPNGAAVRHLDPGTYDIHVVDLSPEHNFHIQGPNVNEATSVEDNGEVTWTVTFVDGTYTFQCDPHAAQMKGSFTVGAVQPPPPPPPAPKPSGFAAGTRLKGTVGPGFSISLKDGAGKAVRKVHAGRTYTVSVSDRSAQHNFHLIGAGVGKKTSVGRTGGATWKLKFKKGTYRFVCDPHKAQMKGSFKAS